MTAATRASDLVESRRALPRADWLVGGGIAIAAGVFAFVLDDLLGVSAVLAAGIGVAYLLFAAGAFAALRRIRAD